MPDYEDEIYELRLALEKIILRNQEDSYDMYELLEAAATTRLIATKALGDS